MANKQLDYKTIFQSLTLWFNSIIFILPEVIWLLDEIVKTNVVTVPQHINLIMKAISVFNILLRLKTRQAIALPNNKSL